MATKSPGRYWDLALRWITGCSRIGTGELAGCDNCWLRGFLMMRPALHDFGVTADKKDLPFPAPPNEPLAHPDLLDLPFRRKKPTVYMTLICEFFDPEISDDFRAYCIGIMKKASQHTFLIPTKRWPEVADFVKWAIFPRNTYILFSCWDHASADAAKAYALAAKHADPDLKWVLNLEPLIGTVVAIGSAYETSLADMPDAVIVGPETGPGRRPCKPEWIDAIRRECAYAGVPCFDKRDGSGSLPWRVK